MTPDDSLDAAELALGLLEGDKHAASFARVSADPEFAREVASWRARFATLLGSVPPAPVDPALEERVLSRIDSMAPPRDSVRRWPWVAGGALGGALAASLAALLLIPPASTPVPPPLPVQRPLLAAAVTPTGDGGGIALPVVVEPAAHAIRIASTPAVPAQRVAQLWRIGHDGVPHSLGLLRASGTTELRVTVALAPGDVLAISIEPEGGAPGATPTGPVVAKGTLLRT